MVNKTLFPCVFAMVLVLAACQDAPPPPPQSEEAHTTVTLTEVWTLSMGLDRPESVVYDPERDVLYVTNIVGPGDAKDGNGYLSRVSPAGELLDSVWVAGLNAPKGLTLDNGQLYVADLDALVVINPEDGSTTARYEVEGDVYLNDVDADGDGLIYVSDSRYDVIYRLQDETLASWLRDPNMLRPNGVHIVGDQLLLAAGDSTSDAPGRARYLRTTTLEPTTLTPFLDETPLGGLDAIEADGQGGYFLSDWSGGRVLHMSRAHGAQVLESFGEDMGTADLTYLAEQNRLYVPVMMQHKLVAYEVQLTP